MISSDKKSVIVMPHLKDFYLLTYHYVIVNEDMVLFRMEITKEIIETGLRRY